MTSLSPRALGVWSILSKKRNLLKLWTAGDQILNILIVCDIPQVLYDGSETMGGRGVS